MMKKILFAICFMLSIQAWAQNTPAPAAAPASSPLLHFEPSPFIDFDGFMKLVQEVAPYRQQRLLSLPDYLTKAGEPGVIILDTRSRNMYELKHIAGAINLPFTDFTQANLARVIPSMDTVILIYCNNNFSDDSEAFPTKAAIGPGRLDNLAGEPLPSGSLSLALNIPTYINLYGYGYRHIYELGELISVNDPRIRFEGISVPATR